MSNLTVRFITNSEFAAWNIFVDESPQGTLFHKIFWLEFSKMPFKILGCYRNKELVAGIPLVYRGRLGLIFIGHPPLTPYLGIVFRDNSALKYVNRLSYEKGIIRDCADVIAQRADLIHIRFQPGFLDLQPFMWAGFKTAVKYTYILNVTDLDRVFRDMDTRRRSEIRKAIKTGSTVSRDASLEDFIELNQMTFERQGEKLSLSVEDLRRLHQVLQKERASQIFIAKDTTGKPCGGTYIVWDNKRAYYLLGGFDPESGSSGAVALALWEAIQYTARELQLSEFDFEGSDIPGVERSFREYGGQLTPYYTVYRAKSIAKLGILGSSAMKSVFRRFKRK